MKLDTKMVERSHGNLLGMPVKSLIYIRERYSFGKIFLHVL
jgi:hypothetical protein